MSGACDRKRGTFRPASWERGYLIGFDANRKRLLSVCTLDHRSSFVARSVVLVSVEKSVRLPTNLIVGNDLPYIFKKPNHPFTALGEFGRFLYLCPPGRRLQLSPDVLEFAVQGSTLAPKEATKTYRINSILRLCSSTSSGSVANSVSSVAIRERRFSILFPMATASCKWVSHREVLSKGSRANIVISVSSVYDL